MIHVNVVEYESGGRPLGFNLLTAEERAGQSSPAEPDGTLIYIPVPRWASSSSLDTLANSIDEQYREATREVVVRLHPDRFGDFRSQESTEDLAARFPSARLSLLSWDQDFRLVKARTGQDLPERCQELVPVLRDAELRALVNRPGVILPQTATYHYEGPSGQHYASFVRVGTAIQAVDSLDGVAFWLLPQLQGCDLIVLDSWTIMSLGLNAARYALQQLPAQDSAGGQRLIDVECLRRYDENRDRLSQRIQSLRHGLAQAPGSVALTLVSVNSTGETAKGLKSTCAEAGFDSIRSASLYVPHDRPADGFCPLPEITPHVSPSDEECEHCKVGSRALPILADSYQLDIAAAVERKAIRELQAIRIKRFISEYGATGALSVHRDQEDGLRHHAVFVDVEKLLKNPAFVTKLEAELDALRGRVELVLSPEHRAGARMAEIASEHLGIPSLCCDQDRLLQLEPEEKSRLEAAPRVLLVDDIVMTGTRLRRYRNRLLTAGYAKHEDFELHFLAGVARPGRLDELRGVSDYAHGRDIRFVEQILLPNWDQRECPWCQELELHNEVGGQVDAEHQAALSERSARLKDTVRGLDDDLFIAWSEPDEGDAASEWLLGPNSIFGATTQVELFVAVASAVQELRAIRDLNEHVTLPVARVLDPPRTFLGRYFDTIIIACVLRATRRHDLRSQDTDPVLEEVVRDRLTDPPNRLLRGELLFALWRQHLPGQNIEEVAEALGDTQADIGLRQLLRAALGLTS